MGFETIIMVFSSLLFPMGIFSICYSHNCHSRLQFVYSFELIHAAIWPPGGWINIKMSSYQYRKSHCGDKTILRPSHLHNGIYYTGKTTSLYWIWALDLSWIICLKLTAGSPNKVQQRRMIFPFPFCSTHLGLALLTLSWDKNWDSHSLVNGYPSFYPRIALVAPSPALLRTKKKS